MYLVSYKTATRPTDLPDGATVERIPREFPVDMRVYGDRLLRVEKSVIHDAYLLVDGSSVHLKTEETRELAHALLELIGDPVSETPVSPTVIRDGDGDYWVVNEGGWWHCTGLRMTLERGYQETRASAFRTPESVGESYRGFTVVK